MVGGEGGDRVEDRVDIGEEGGSSEGKRVGMEGKWRKKTEMGRYMRGVKVDFEKEGENEGEKEATRKKVDLEEKGRRKEDRRK